MRQVKVGIYFDLGMAIRTLKLATKIDKEKTVASTKLEVVYKALNKITSLVYLVNTEINVYNEVRQFTAALQKKYKSDTSTLLRKDTQVLYEKTLQWERLLKQSMFYVSCYNFTYDSNINIVKLEQEGVKAIYGEKVWNKLSDIAKKDLEEASKCLVFECPTAAGILALRAAESVLRDFYDRKLGQTGAQVAKKTWGALLQDLEKTTVNPNLIYNLKYIKNEHRNPLSHPTIYLAQEEAETTFFLVKQVITEMVKN